MMKSLITKGTSKRNVSKEPIIYKSFSKVSAYLSYQTYQTDLTKSVMLVMLDFITLLFLTIIFYYALVASCIFDNECFTMFYGATQ